MRRVSVLCRAPLRFLPRNAVLEQLLSPRTAPSAALAVPWWQFGDLGQVPDEDSTAGAAPAVGIPGWGCCSGLGMQEESHLGGLERKRGNGEEQGASSTQPQAGSWLSQGWDLG